MKLNRVKREITPVLAIKKDNNALIERGIKISQAVDVQERSLNKIKIEHEEVKQALDKEFRAFVQDIQKDKEIIMNEVSSLKQKREDAEKPLDTIIRLAEQELKDLKITKEETYKIVDLVKDFSHGLQIQYEKLSDDFANKVAIYDKKEKIMEDSKKYLNEKEVSILKLTEKCDQSIEQIQEMTNFVMNELVKINKRLEEKEIVLDVKQSELEKDRKILETERKKLTNDQLSLKADYDYLRRKNLL